MRAAITRAGRLSVEDVPAPAPQLGQVLVRTLACGICGSDLHALAEPDLFTDVLRRAGGTPHNIGDGIVLGHEYAAEIVDYGPDTVRALPIGSAVCGPPIAFGPQGTGIIGYTPDFPGGFGEYMIWPEAFTMAIPNGLAPEVAALTEPFAVAARAVRRAGLAAGDVAMVLGLGAIGLGVVAVLKARGHSPVVGVDFSPTRRRLAELLGADLLIDPAEQAPYECWDSVGVLTGTMDRMAAEYRGIKVTDAALFECVGSPGMFNQVVNGAPAAAKVVLVGVCLTPDAVDLDLLTHKELDVRGSFGCSPTEYRQTLLDIGEGRVEAAAIITGTTSIGGLPRVIAELGGSNDHGKIVVVASTQRRCPDLDTRTIRDRVRS
jgi:threonine dehydrogenase-like Zn-dependent dehydrogenase